MIIKNIWNHRLDHPVQPNQQGFVRLWTFIWKKKRYLLSAEICEQAQFAHIEEPRKSLNLQIPQQVVTHTL